MFELFDSNAEFRIDSGASLPHWFQPCVSYFVTFRTVDSIPIEVARNWHLTRNDWLARHGISPQIAGWETLLRGLPKVKRQEYHEKFSQAYLNELDRGHGACVLGNPQWNAVVAESLLHFDGSRYHMSEFVVMPNHVHVLVGLIGETEIVRLCTSWKRYSARKINLALGRAGRFWQEESFDHLVRSPEQFRAIQRYICSNPSGLKEGNFYLYSRLSRVEERSTIPYSHGVAISPAPFQS